MENALDFMKIYEGVLKKSDYNSLNIILSFICVVALQVIVGIRLSKG